MFVLCCTTLHGPFIERTTGHSWLWCHCQFHPDWEARQTQCNNQQQDAQCTFYACFEHTKLQAGILPVEPSLLLLLVALHCWSPCQAAGIWGSHKFTGHHLNYHQWYEHHWLRITALIHTVSFFFPTTTSIPIFSCDHGFIPIDFRFYYQ